MNSRNWKIVTYESLKSYDSVTYWNAKQAAEKLGIDLWETVWARLVEKPHDSSSWYDVTHYCKLEHSDKIIDFALNHLPLDKMATGAKDQVAFGENHIKFGGLDYVITFLEDYPKKGEQIILTGLKCPVTRNRNLTIKVLDKWKIENWSTEIVNEVRFLSEVEPNSDTKENITRLLNGEKLK